METRIRQKEERYRKIKAGYQILLSKHWSRASSPLTSEVKQLLQSILREVEGLQTSASLVEAQLYIVAVNLDSEK